MRKRGGILGPKKTVTASSAVGFWDLTTLQQELGAATWPTIPVFVDYLVIAGGGGGGRGRGGGGGAGGLRSTITSSGGTPGTVESNLALTLNQNYTVTVGAGGTPGTAGVAKGANGSDSVFSTITSIGGGGGGSDSGLNNGANGGSGGGGNGTNGLTTGGTGTSGQGFAGGSNINISPPYPSAGGGGAGAVGANGAGNNSGNGGAGVSTTITGSSTSYAGGGGGGRGESGGVRGIGGSGGGGNGSDDTAVAQSGTANTGGGAGGGTYTYAGGTGGSGVVILRYSNLYTMTVGAGLAYSTTPVGNDKVTTFTGGSGSISFSPTPSTTGDYESIATVLVGSAGASTVTFSNIPQTYKHLQLRTLARNSGEFISIRATFNGDNTSVYTIHELYGDGASVLAAAQTNIAYYPCGLVGPNSATGVFGSAITDILDYQSTDKFKTMRTLTGYDANGSGYVELTGGVWRNTSAITSITIVPNGGTLVQHSHFALYGIRG